MTGTVSRAAAATASPRSSAVGCGIVAHSNHGAPSKVAIARAAPMNGSVITTAAGTPRRSKVMPSCTLHELHDPQSPMAVSTTWTCAANVVTT